MNETIIKLDDTTAQITVNTPQVTTVSIVDLRANLQQIQDDISNSQRMIDTFTAQMTDSKAQEADIQAQITKLNSIGIN